ncbi:unnamed protein product [Amoebophrya sp. A25]|nr:unnamed protein product [Amoebophrya sp. A25]|eukprot:GSA25T00004346001.1
MPFRVQNIDELELRSSGTSAPDSQLTTTVPRTSRDGDTGARRLLLAESMLVESESSGENSSSPIAIDDQSVISIPSSEDEAEDHTAVPAIKGALTEKDRRTSDLLSLDKLGELTAQMMEYTFTQSTDTLGSSTRRILIAQENAANPGRTLIIGATSNLYSRGVGYKAGISAKMGPLEVELESNVTKSHKACRRLCGLAGHLFLRLVDLENTPTSRELPDVNPTPPERLAWDLRGTFTSIAANMSARFLFHRDRGNLSGSYSLIFAYGNYSGGRLMVRVHTQARKRKGCRLQEMIPRPRRPDGTIAEPDCPRRVITAKERNEPGGEDWTVDLYDIRFPRALFVCAGSSEHATEPFEGDRKSMVFYNFGSVYNVPIDLEDGENARPKLRVEDQLRRSQCLDLLRGLGAYPLTDQRVAERDRERVEKKERERFHNPRKRRNKRRSRGSNSDSVIDLCSSDDESLRSCPSDGEQSGPIVLD